MTLLPSLLQCAPALKSPQCGQLLQSQTYFCMQTHLMKDCLQLWSQENHRKKEVFLLMEVFPNLTQPDLHLLRLLQEGATSHDFHNKANFREPRCSEPALSKVDWCEGSGLEIYELPSNVQRWKGKVRWKCLILRLTSTFKCWWRFTGHHLYWWFNWEAQWRWVTWLIWGRNEWDFISRAAWNSLFLAHVWFLTDGFTGRVTCYLKLKPLS